MKQLKLWIGIVISAVAIYFAFKDIKFDQVGDTFSRLNWWLLALSFIPYFLTLFMKVTRWQLLFKPGPQIRLGRLWATLMMSYFFNTVLPARLGEVVRAYALSRSERIGPVRVLSTILLEKILDVMTMFIFLVGLLPFLDIKDDFKRIAFITCGIVVGGFVVCVLMAIYRRQAEALINWFLKPLPAKWGTKISGLTSEVLDVLSVLLDLKLSLNLWAQSILMWLLAVANYMLASAALNIPLSWQLAFLLTITLNLAMVVPSAPAYVGVFEYTVLTVLGPFFPGQQSLLISLGLLLHLAGYAPVVAFGAYYTSREGVNVGKLTKPVPAVPATTPPEVPQTNPPEVTASRL